MEIALIRHTPVQAAPGLCYGITDLPLAATAAQDIAQVLAGLRAVDRVISSPATRCRLLAALLELDFGAWEGLSWDAIDRRQSDPWAADPWNLAPPGGESESALWRRLANWLAAEAAPLRGRMAIVAHGGPLRLLRCHFSGCPREHRWSVPMPPGSIVELPWPDGRPWSSP